jgi:hypothetical protein
MQGSASASPCRGQHLHHNAGVSIYITMQGSAYTSPCRGQHLHHHARVRSHAGHVETYLDTSITKMLEMISKVGTCERMFVCAYTDVWLVHPHRKGVPACDKHPAPDVEFALVQQQTVLDVPACACTPICWPFCMRKTHAHRHTYHA